MLDYARERSYGPCGLIAGVDEAGRGPLAGPVVAAAVILDPQRIPHGLDDSKALSAKKREALFSALMSNATVGIGAASVADIARLNILHAAMLAMRRAVAALPVSPALALIDGNRCPDLPCASEAVVGGDALVVSIAAASIVAKVTRDRIMAALGTRWPAYGFERHMGYPTKAHRLALKTLGPTSHHRMGFAVVHQI